MLHYALKTHFSSNKTTQSRGLGGTECMYKTRSGKYIKALSTTMKFCKYIYEVNAADERSRGCIKLKKNIVLEK